MSDKHTTISYWVVSLCITSFAAAGCTGKLATFKYELASLDGSPPHVVAAPPNGKALYEVNCSGCHGTLSSSAKAGADPARIRVALATIPAMAHLQTKLSDAMIEAIGKTLLGTLVIQTCTSAPDVGHVAAHRLNNLEYDNTINAILGTTARWSTQLSFPPDEFTGGFNNNAQVQFVTPTTVQKYLEGAETALAAAFASPALKLRLINCNAALPTCVDSVLRSFLLKAFRRPPSAAELTEFTLISRLSQGEGDSAERGLQVAMTAALISPHFLYRLVRLPNPVDTLTPVALNAYELASRISYFLWSSMPDDQLLAQAANGQLLTETVLAAQVQRMLRDPKATSLVDTFSHQWLRLAKLDEASPSAAIFPSFSEELRTDMKTESRMVIQDMFMRDGSFFELLSLDSTFANQRLAEHYGIAGVTGTQFRKVSLAGTQRAGILTHASLLTANSVSDRTSIIKRGHWVLSNLLCNPPPPPPPDVIGGLPPANLNGITERQRLEAHRSDPACLGCHSKIDPIGFALEGFDGIGKFRTMDNGSPIDSSGEFPDGRKVTGSLQLSTILSEDPRFKLCVAEKLFAYALGRQPEFYDRCTINRIGVEKVAPTQPLSNAILEVIRSDPFRKQRGASVP